MRLLGLDIKRAAAAKEEPLKGRARIIGPASRRSYDNPLGLDMSKTVKVPVDLALYDTITRSLPFVDRAFRTLSRMITPFEITCDNEPTQEALTQWLEDVRVNYLFRGFQAFGRPYVRQALKYGKTAGEVVLAPSKREIEGLHVIDGKVLRIVRDDEQGLLLGQDDGKGGVSVYETPELFVYSAINSEGDNPHGVSLLRSVPFVADCLLRMEMAVRRLWQRSGAPSFLIWYQVDKDVGITDDKLKEIQSALETDWHDSQKVRWNEEGIQDFAGAGQGTLMFQAIGSDVKELTFEQPHRAMQEQIVASVELAPFMLGLQWSTTERMSQQQADCIVSTVEDIRVELKPDFLHILDWVQRVMGLRGKVGLAWKPVNLQDAREQAMAEFMAARTRKTKIDNALLGWANGFWDQEGAKDKAGYEEDGPPVMPLDLPVMGKGGEAGMEAWGQHEETQWQQYP